MFMRTARNTKRCADADSNAAPSVPGPNPFEADAVLSPPNYSGVCEVHTAVELETSHLL